MVRQRENLGEKGFRVKRRKNDKKERKGRDGEFVEKKGFPCFFFVF